MSASANGHHVGVAGDDVYVLDGRTQPLGHELGEAGLVALALRDRADDHIHDAIGAHGDLGPLARNAGGRIHIVGDAYATQAPARRPIVPHEASATVRRRERRLALGTIGIILVLGTATTILVLAGRLQVATGPASAGRIAAEASAWLLVVEFYLYGLHRLLHTARLFRSVHRLHHLSSAPTAWTALALHPVEALAAFGSFPLLVAVHPVHPTTIALVSVFMISALLATHVNHDPLPKAWHRVAPLNWLTTPLVHVGHHANARINFGAATTIPDRVFATHRVDLSYYDPRREASLPAGSRGW